MRGHDFNDSPSEPTIRVILAPSIVDGVRHVIDATPSMITRCDGPPHGGRIPVVVYLFGRPVGAHVVSP